jgi:predicted dehydrogenase
MTKKVRIAVVGTGWWASDVHIPALLAHGSANLVALCDVDEKRLAASATKYNIQAAYTNLETMLNEQTLDGVIVASSNASHYRVAKTCLEHDLHVFVEKPMTLYAAHAKELYDLALARRRELVVGYPFNLLPYVQEVRAVLTSKALGEVQLVNLIYNSHMVPFFSGQFPYTFTVHEPAQYVKPEETGGGHGYVQLSHALGLLFFITELCPSQVTAMMSKQTFSVDVVDAVTVAFTNGAIGTVAGTGNQQGLTFRLVMNCENGWVDMDMVLHRAIIHRNDAEPETLHHQPRDSIGFLPARHFVDVMLANDKNRSPGILGWRAVEVLESAYRSAARDGAVVAIKELYENH